MDLVAIKGVQARCGFLEEGERDKQKEKISPV